VVIVGLYSRFEIWDEENWEIYKRNTEKASTQIAEKMGEIGF
jgi:DNA-binding transcriptional regulator/RsmH inhibitor MraZ